MQFGPAVNWYGCDSVMRMEKTVLQYEPDSMHYDSPNQPATHT